jgi:hypothetical protein
MKLNNKQSLAILNLLICNKMVDSERIFRDLISFGELFDDQTKEIRVIHRYGIAGKLWNANGRIYVSGHSDREVNDIHYQKERGEIDEVNNHILGLIELYSD